MCKNSLESWRHLFLKVLVGSFPESKSNHWPEFKLDKVKRNVVMLQYFAVNVTLLMCPTAGYTAIATISLTKINGSAVMWWKWRALRNMSSHSQRQNYIKYQSSPSLKSSLRSQTLKVNCCSNPRVNPKCVFSHFYYNANLVCYFKYNKM